MEQHLHSVVLAALNEASTIETVVRGCYAALGADAEVIVVDDGSADDTAARARAAGARVFRLGRNRGKGFAQRHGVQKARGEIVILLDADGQDDPADIPLLLDGLRGADMVVGSRFLGERQPGAITPLNTAGNRALTALINRLFAARLTDTQAGFRALRRHSYLRCSPRAVGFDVETDVLLRALKLGLRVVEVPVSRAPRVTGRSRLRTVRDGTRILARIVRSRLSPAG